MADEIKDRIRQYHDAKYSALYCLDRTPGPREVYGHWERIFCSYGYSAVAEWTWNVKGRDMHEFALAWATVNGLTQPERFAAWVDVIRPVASFVRYWELSQTANWIKAAGELSNAKSTPAWIARLHKPDEIKQLLAKCDSALPIAHETEDQSVLLETQYLRTYLQAMVQFRDLHRQCAAADRKAIESAAKAFLASVY